MRVRRDNEDHRVLMDPKETEDLKVSPGYQDFVVVDPAEFQVYPLTCFLSS